LTTAPFAPAAAPLACFRARTPARLRVCLFLCLLAATAASGCANAAPPPLRSSELAEAQTFPFFRVYFAGPRFSGRPLVAADGLHNYNPAVGTSLYYGGCTSGRGALGGEGCVLGLQVATRIYARHANAPLGPQRNTVLRGVPAVVYDGGRSIELYTGRLAVDVFSEGLSEGLRAVAARRAGNAPGSASTPLPSPVFCPGLVPARPAAVRALLRRLPGRPCAKVARTLVVDRALFGKG
jgi:hypothetical protein